MSSQKYNITNVMDLAPHDTAATLGQQEAGKVAALLCILINRNALQTAKVSSIFQEVAGSGQKSAALYHVLVASDVSSTEIVLATVRLFDQLGSNLPVFDPATERPQRLGDSWVYTDGGFLYHLNPLDTKAMAYIADSINGDVAGNGVISQEDLHELHREKEFGSSRTFTRKQLSGKNHDQSPAEYLDEILKTAVHQEASDVQFMPRGHEVLVRLKIDGAEYTHTTISNGPNDSFYSDLATHVQQRSNEDGFHKPTSGRLKFRVAERDYKGRTGVCLVVTEGYDEGVPHITIRILNNNRLRSLAQLGIPNDEDFDIASEIWRVLSSSAGMFLMTGPTGHGKTTTLAAIMPELQEQRPNQTMYEIGEPIEIPQANVNQIEVSDGGVNTGHTWKSVNKGLKRKAPDIIVTQEIRDAYEMNQAIDNAQTGHFVMASLHATSAAATPARVLQMGQGGNESVNTYAFASSVVGIAAQRLIPAICPSCGIDELFGLLESGKSKHLRDILQRQTYRFARETLGDIPDFPGPNDTVRLINPNGCRQCNSRGTRGVRLVIEVLRITPEIRSLIEQSASVTDVAKTWYESGGKNMWDHAVRLWAQGAVSLDSLKARLMDREYIPTNPAVKPQNTSLTAVRR